MTTTPTPRTDAAVKKRQKALWSETWKDAFPSYKTVLASDMAALERELERLQKNENRRIVRRDLRGNTVGYVYQKLRNYGKVIDDCCAQFHMDGETSVVDMIAKQKSELEQAKQERDEARQGNELALATSYQCGWDAGQDVLWAVAEGLAQGKCDCCATENQVCDFCQAKAAFDKMKETRP